MRIFHRVAIAAFGGEVLPLPEDVLPKMNAHLARLHEEGYAPVTIRNHLAIMRYFCEAMGEPEALAACKLPVKLKKQLTRTLVEDEVSRVFTYLAKHDPKAKGIFELVLLTGLRLSEIMGLQYTRADLDARRVLVTAPNGQPRPVFLGARACTLLAGYLSPRKRLPRDSRARLQLTESLRKAGLALDIPEVTPSRLRMTYAVRMLLAEHSLDFVAKNMGLNQGTSEACRRLREVLVDHLARVNNAT